MILAGELQFAILGKIQVLMGFKPCLPDSCLVLLPTELQDFLLGVIMSSPQP